MRIVVLRSAHLEPIVASHAVRFSERLLGRWFPGALESLVIDSASVHSLGSPEPIGVVGLDRDLIVVGAKVLEPNRVVWFRKARHMLEVPKDTILPQVGDSMELTHV